MEALKHQQCGSFRYVGDLTLWLPYKATAFITSPDAPAEQAQKCLDWAIAMRDAGKCVMLGDHSPLEKDMLRELLKGTQPVILVLDKRLMRSFAPEVKAGICSRRLLVVTQYGLSIRHATRATAAARIEFMLSEANKAVVGYKDPAGPLKKQLDTMTWRVKQL